MQGKVHCLPVHIMRGGLFHRSVIVIGQTVDSGGSLLVLVLIPSEVNQHDRRSAYHKVIAAPNLFKQRLCIQGQFGSGA